MTREEKIAWLENANNDDVLEQLRWTVTALTNTISIERQMEANLDYKLVTAELKKRLDK